MLVAFATHYKPIRYQKGQLLLVSLGYALKLLLTIS